MATKTKKTEEAPVEVADTAAPPEPVFTIEAPARQVPEQLGLKISSEYHAVRSAVAALFFALDDGGNKPTKVDVKLEPGKALAVTVAQEPEGA